MAGRREDAPSFYFRRPPIVFLRPFVSAAPLVLQAPWWSEGPEVFLFFFWRRALRAGRSSGPQLLRGVTVQFFFSGGGHFCRHPLSGGVAGSAAGVVEGGHTAHSVGFKGCSRHSRSGVDWGVYTSRLSWAMGARLASRDRSCSENDAWQVLLGRVGKREGRFSRLQYIVASSFVRVASSSFCACRVAVCPCCVVVLRPCRVVILLSVSRRFRLSVSRRRLTVSCRRRRLSESRRRVSVSRRIS